MKATQTTYQTIIVGFGEHAAIEIPDANLAEIGGNRRAPLKVRVNDYTYQSTATGVSGKCMVVFPTRDRDASGVKAGDTATITLEIDDGYRTVNIPPELSEALQANNLSQKFHDLIYSQRKEYARLVADAKATETKDRRLTKIISTLADI